MPEAGDLVARLASHRAPEVVRQDDTETTRTTSAAVEHEDNHADGPVAGCAWCGAPVSAGPAEAAEPAPDDEDFDKLPATLAEAIAQIEHEAGGHSILQPGAAYALGSLGVVAGAGPGCTSADLAANILRLPEAGSSVTTTPDAEAAEPAPAISLAALRAVAGGEPLDEVASDYGVPIDVVREVAPLVGRDDETTETPTLSPWGLDRVGSGAAETPTGDEHVVTKHWDVYGGHVVERTCSCGEAWTHDEDHCPEDPRELYERISEAPAFLDAIANDIAPRHAHSASILRLIGQDIAGQLAAKRAGSVTTTPADDPADEPCRADEGMTGIRCMLDEGHPLPHRGWWRDKNDSTGEYAVYIEWPVPERVSGIRVVPKSGPVSTTPDPDALDHGDALAQIAGVIYDALVSDRVGEVAAYHSSVTIANALASRPDLLAALAGSGREDREDPA